MENQKLQKDAEIASASFSLQMKMMENVSGITATLQGQNVNTSGSASLYQTQAANSSIALYDIFDTFNNFRHLRTQKALAL